MIDADYELEIELSNWRQATSHIPDAQLQRCYEHAAKNWDWQDTRRAFTCDALPLSYSILIVEDRQRREATMRNAAREPELAECHFCCNTGYQAVFSRTSTQGWHQTARPCCCSLAPLATRSAEALAEPDYVRDKLGRYVQRSLLEQFGAPASSFEQFIPAQPSPFTPEEIERLQAEIERLEQETGCVSSM